MSNWQQKYERMSVTFTGHGHWRVDVWSTDYRRIIKSCVTTDSMAVDDFKSSDYQRSGRYLTRKSGVEALWNEVQRKSRNTRVTNRQ